MSTSLLIVLLMTGVVSQLTLTSGQAVMSIDLGSEYFKIAIVKPGVPMEIVLNRESKRKTPMVVAMRDGERLFSDPALSTAVRFPKNAFRFIRDLLGKQFDHPIVQRYMKWFPYYNMTKDEETGMVVFNFDENTSYTVEELIAMVFEHARHCAEVFADNKMKDVVVTVPVYFNIAERRALVRAVELAGLNLLQLISDGAAVALNYGIFRRASFTNVTQHIMFYDMGSTCTTATIVGYQMVKSKVAGMLETDPQLVVKGVGFDSTLGGVEMTLRLRDHLAAEFTKYKKTKSDVYANDRAMAKLWKEAERLKQILSANTEYAAQVEGLLDDEDFKVRVTREQFEEMCKDLFERFMRPVVDALKFSQITPAEIQDVILMGGGTRMPYVQSYLRSFLKRDDLGKSINTDEAAALGAVYQAAHLTVGFKVKRFLVKEAVVHPVVVQFDRQTSSANDHKTIKRTLFGHMNPFPQKKVMTFNKHNHDFVFNLTYGELSHITDDSKPLPDQRLLLTVSLNGVADAHYKNSPVAESKGVKAHFRLDESGLLHLDTVESVFEKMPNASDSQSTWSKIGDALGGLFGSSKTKEDIAAANATDDEKKEKAEDESAKKVDTKIKDEKNDSSKSSNETDKMPDKKNVTAKAQPPKPVVIKENITVSQVIMDSHDPSPLSLAASRRKLGELREKDLAKQALEQSKNDLESFIYDMQDKLGQDPYIECSLEAERTELGEMVREADDWQTEQMPDAPKEVFIDKLNALKKKAQPLEGRVREYLDRPKAIEDLRGMIKHGQNFTLTIRNLSRFEPEVLTEVEMTTLEKLVNSTDEWLNSSIADQAKTPLHLPPVFTHANVMDKGAAIAREIQYLVTKIMSFRKKAPKPVEKNETASNTTKAKPRRKDKAESEKDSVKSSEKVDETKSTKQTLEDLEKIPGVKVLRPEDFLDGKSDIKLDESDLKVETTMAKDNENVDGKSETPPADETQTRDTAEL